MTVTDITTPATYTCTPPTPPPFIFDRATAVVDLGGSPVSPTGTGHNHLRRVTAHCGCAVTVLRASRRWLPTSYEWSDDAPCHRHSSAALRDAVWEFLGALRDARRATA